MPAKFKVKEYRNNSRYYIYSRAVAGRNVFEDEVDYLYFVSLMERYCGGIIKNQGLRYKSDRPYRIKRKISMTLKNEVKVLAYCLLRQGIYLLVWQKHKNGITQLLRRIITGYTMYVNKRHRQKGKLFSGAYRGVLVPSKEKLIYLSRWIHLLPKTKKVKRFGLVESETNLEPEEYLYSSFGKYVNGVANEWFDTGPVMQPFEKLKVGRWKSYSDFVGSKEIDNESEGIIGEFLY